MRAINHALTGAIIGLSIKEPVIALPLALVSHLALDMIPHEGGIFKKTSRAFNVLLLVDFGLCVTLVAFIFALRPESWLLPSLAAFVATSPDLLHIPGWLDEMKGKAHKYSPVSRFLSYIQWSETPLGIITEVLWFIGSVAVVAKLI